MLGTAKARDLFVKVLEEVRRRYHFVVVGFVVMPEHVHLRIGEPSRGNPSTVMQVVKQSFARRLLRRERARTDGRRATLWFWRWIWDRYCNDDSTTSRYGVSASVGKSCATCIVIR
jgi:REP element-mobilizing transposase RayT